MKNNWRFIPILILLVAGSFGCPGNNSPTSAGSGSPAANTSTPTVTGTLPTATSTATATPTGTPSSTATKSPTSTLTATPTNTFLTSTPTSTATLTATSTATRTATNSPTLTASATPTNTFPTSTPTSTATSTTTSTATRTATNTATPTVTSTPTATASPTATIAYSTSFGSASLSSPLHIVAVGSSPVSLFVTDTTLNKVVVLNGGTGALITSFSTLHLPQGIAANSAGTTVYVMEEASGSASYIEYYTAAGVRQTGLETLTGNPIGIDVALDSSAGKLYALCENTGGTNHDQVVVFNVGSTSAVSSFNLNAALTYDLTGIAVDSSNVYISTDQAYVAKYTKAGVAGSQFNVVTNSTAEDVKPDGSGNFLIPVYIFPSSYIQKVDSSFSAVATFGNSQFTTAQPAGVAVDSSGNIYVVDATNHQIVKYLP